MNSPKFKALWGSPPSLTLTKKVPIIDIIIPEAAINKGSNTALISIPENYKILGFITAGIEEKITSTKDKKTKKKLTHNEYFSK